MKRVIITIFLILLCLCFSGCSNKTAKKFDEISAQLYSFSEDARFIAGICEDYMYNDDPEISGAFQLIHSECEKLSSDLEDYSQRVIPRD